MENPNFLFMAIIGCTPKGRLTEQHDVFFGIGKSMKDLTAQMLDFWPEADGRIHIDAWRKVSKVDGFRIEVSTEKSQSEKNLFFINLGGYKPGEFDEYHYKMLAIADSMGDAVKQSKSTAFYKHYGFKGATSHVDDKYGIDVDDFHNVQDVLPKATQNQFSLRITPDDSSPEDELHIGYFKFDKLP